MSRTSHSVYGACYHLDWCPKYREKIFERVDVRERTTQMISEICEAYDIEILEMEIMEEHIDLQVSFRPSRSIGEAVRIIKGNSGRGIFRWFTSLKEKLWEDGYFARIYGDRLTRDVVDKHIKHHRNPEQGYAQLALKLR